MKFGTIERATSFMESFSIFLDKFHNFALATDKFNEQMNAHLECSCGSVRQVVLCSDYVIKWDYDQKNLITLGGCEREFEIYKQVLNSGYSYLFAEIAPIVINGKNYWVMPRVLELACDLEDSDIDDYLSDEEKDFLYEDMQICDLHPWNWGLVDGHPVIIDYACGPESAS